MITHCPPVWIPHLREIRTPWRDLDEYPFVPLDDDRPETDDEAVIRKRMQDHVSRFGHEFWMIIPAPGDDAYEAYWKDSHLDFMRFMAVSESLWDVGHNGADWRPIAPPVVYRRSDFSEKATLANVVAPGKDAMPHLRFFDSMGEARRNGWNKPIVPGLYTVTSDRRRLQILPDDVVREDKPEAMAARWSYWSRRWDGEQWVREWKHIASKPFVEAERIAMHDCVFVIRSEPTMRSKGVATLATELDAKNRSEVIMIGLVYWPDIKEVVENLGNYYCRRDNGSWFPIAFRAAEMTPEEARRKFKERQLPIW